MNQEIQAVLAGTSPGCVAVGNCYEVLRAMPGGCVDLVFGSPPYEDARTYGIHFGLKGQAWVDWMVEVYRQSLRVCRGLVAFVVEGRTRKYSYSGTPLLLAADLLRAGITLRKPPAFHRVGVPGSGGPDWWRNDYEFIICATNGGKLPWSDNTACGHPPKWAPGGEMSNRVSDGTRVNQWGGHARSSGYRLADGTMREPGRPSHNFGHAGDGTIKGTHARDIPHRVAKMVSARNPDGSRDNDKVESYVAPVLANPGNVLHCIVGGGVMGSKLAHENEAPFPEKLAERFILSFCPPGGIVADCFSGSGTTAAVAAKNGRRYIASDVRESQCELTRKRIARASDNQLALFGENP